MKNRSELEATINDMVQKGRGVLAADESDVVDVKEVAMDTPPKAQMHKSIKCDVCGEAVMETRIRDMNGSKLCIPCAQER